MKAKEFEKRGIKKYLYTLDRYQFAEAYAKEKVEEEAITWKEGVERLQKEIKQLWESESFASKWTEADIEVLTKRAIRAEKEAADLKKEIEWVKQVATKTKQE